MRPWKGRCELGHFTGPTDLQYQVRHRHLPLGDAPYPAVGILPRPRLHGDAAGRVSGRQEKNGKLGRLEELICQQAIESALATMPSISGC